MIAGHATPEATAAYVSRLIKEKNYAPDFFDAAQGLSLSSIGLGTYLGNADAETSALYEEAVETALLSGCNVIDSAINYRFQLSERNIGNALKKLTQNGKIRREEILLCTKGGFIPFDGGLPENPTQYFKDTFEKTDVVSVKDVVSGCHCIAPKYIEHQLNASLKNMNVECIDLYYLHNPEQQFDEVSKEEFYRRIRAAFDALENAVSEGKIRMYGTATWNGYRRPPNAPDYLSLENMVRLAKEAAGENHHFKAIQLPLNLIMLEALSMRNQGKDAQFVSILESAEHFGVSVFSSASILQGELAQGLPERLHGLFPEGFTDAHIALQFVRSSPGVTTALCGMKQKKHLEDNLKLFHSPRMNKADYVKLFAAKA